MILFYVNMPARYRYLGYLGILSFLNNTTLSGVHPSHPFHLGPGSSAVANRTVQGGDARTAAVAGDLATPGDGDPLALHPRALCDARQRGS